jgi:hypothetical protein
MGFWELVVDAAMLAGGGAGVLACVQSLGLDAPRLLAGRHEPTPAAAGFGPIDFETVALADDFGSGTEETRRQKVLVRKFFRQYVLDHDALPPTYAEQLTAAESYINLQLARNGETWRLDAETRARLGFPPAADGRVRAA